MKAEVKESLVQHIIGGFNMNSSKLFKVIVFALALKPASQLISLPIYGLPSYTSLKAKLSTNPNDLSAVKEILHNALLDLAQNQNVAYIKDNFDLKALRDLELRLDFKKNIFTTISTNYQTAKKYVQENPKKVAAISLATIATLYLLHRNKADIVAGGKKLANYVSNSKPVSWISSTYKKVFSKSSKASSSSGITALLNAPDVKRAAEITGSPAASK